MCEECALQHVRRVLCCQQQLERKEIFVRALRRINNDSLEANLAGIKIDFDCDDINVVSF